MPETNLETRDPRDIVLPGGILTRTGINFSEGVTLEEWQAMGEVLRRCDEAVAWWIGDWMIYGEQHEDAWGEHRYQQALSIWSGYDYSEIRKYKAISHDVGYDLRRDNLRWGHHVAVRSLSSELQDQLLEAAEPESADVKPKISVKEMNDIVRFWKNGHDIDAAIGRVTGVVSELASGNGAVIEEGVAQEITEDAADAADVEEADVEEDLEDDEDDAEEVVSQEEAAETVAPRRIGVARQRAPSTDAEGGDRAGQVLTLQNQIYTAAGQLARLTDSLHRLDPSRRHHQGCLTSLNRYLEFYVEWQGAPT
jgi:hypothetical protein